MEIRSHLILQAWLKLVARLLLHLVPSLRDLDIRVQVEQRGGRRMNIRRLVLDVDKAIARPTLIEITEALEKVPGLQALNILVTEIDLETVGMDITIEGEYLDYHKLVKAIESTGAVVHSIDQLAAGDRTIEPVRRER
jgi:hypothetical protein